MDVVRTSIYLPQSLHTSLRVAALTDKVKMNDLLIDGVKQLLDARPDPHAPARLLRAEVEALKAQAVADAAERDRLQAQVRDMQAKVEAFVKGEGYRKGAGFAEAVSFWDLVMDDAATIIRKQDAPMTPDEVFPKIDPALKAEAALGAQKITPALLRKKMLTKAEHSKYFVHDASTGGFSLLDS